jgi:hypothetical protein
VTEEQVRAALAKAVDAAGGQRAFGRAHKISAAYVSLVLSGDRFGHLHPPSERICAALGIERETLIRYRRLEK